MPLTLLIESELDERSATAAANRAERVYADASRNISKSMSSQIGDGAQAAGKAIEKMADSARDSYKKVLAAQDELAQQERQLKQMREDGARGVEVQAERVRQARRAEKDAIREAASELSEYERATQRVGESGARAGTMLRQGLRTGLEGGVSDYTRQFGAMGNIADSALTGISTKALVAGAGVGAIALGAIEAGKALYNLGKQWDDIADSMTIATGATGDELKRMTDIVGDVGSTTAAPLGVIGGITEQLKRSLPDLEQNDAAMRQMVSNLSYLNANGVAVDVREMSMAFRAFGVDADHAVPAFDSLSRASRNSDLPLNELISSVRAGAPQFRQFGLSIGQSTSLLTSFAQAGVDPKIAVTGLLRALKSVGGEGKEAANGFAAVVTQIKALHDAQQEGAAQQLASDKFGTRNAAAFLQVIESGALNVQALNKALQDTGMTLRDMQDITDDGAQSWEKMTNRLKTDFKPVADATFGFINTQVSLMTGHFGDAMDIFNDGLSSANQKLNDAVASAEHLANVKIAPDSALGKMLTPGGPSAVQGDTPLPLPTTRPTTPVTGLEQNPYTTQGSPLYYPQLKPGDPGYAGNDNIIKPTTGRADAAVPYGPGYGRAPRPGESTAMYSAEQNVLEAQHKRATAEAVLAQVMADTTHTTNDEIKAQNDVAQAKKAEIDANMRLRDTSVKAAESLNKATGQLNDFGASIDADFGISKGLPGIVENITKMLGNFALAGPMAQMNALSAANPNQGSGLMGMLASQGVFGSQYTPQAIAAASGGSGGYGGTTLSAGLRAAMGTGPGMLYDTGHTPSGPQSQQAAALIQQMFGGQLRGPIGGSRDTGTAPGTHDTGTSIDIPIGADQGALGDEINAWLQSHAGELGLKYSIWRNRGQYPGGGGFNQPGHQDHIDAHFNGAAMPFQSNTITATTGGNFGNFGTPGSPQAIANMIYQKAIARGYNAHEAQSIVAYAVGESSLNPGISGGNQGGDEVIGLFQEKSAFARGGGIDPSQRSNPEANTDAYLNQLERHRNLPIEQALPATSVGGPLASGPGAQPQNWGNLMSRAAGYLGSTPSSDGGGGRAVAGPTGGGQGFPLPWNLGTGPGWAGGGGPGVGGAGGFGLSPAPQSPGVGGAAGQDPFGVAPTTGPGGGGLGITPGGTIDTAIGIAAAGADLFAPGAGAAAQAGIKLASRAIQYGGQVAGIAADGWLQTLLPAESQKAGSGWLQRGVGALASVKPALPNLAGGKSPNAQNGQGSGQGQQPGQAGGGNTVNYNTTVNSNASTIGGAAKDAEFHFSAQNSAPGQH